MLSDDFPIDPIEHRIDVPTAAGARNQRILRRGCALPGGIVLDDGQQAIVTRPNRIEGQIRGIRRTVLESRLCLDILQQLAAAEAALNRISLAVLKFHVERCVPEGIAKGEPERTDRLTELVDIFDRFARQRAAPPIVR